MHISHILAGLLAALVVASGAGCKKSEPGAPAALPALSADTVARIHWLGKKRLGTDAGAYYFMRLWGLRETAQLEARTLDKLSVTLTNVPGALLRPLFNDMVQAETYFEIRQTTNQPLELVFAIRLDDRRASAWQTNLAAVIESLTGIRPAARQGNLRGWSLKQTQTPNVIELTRVGDWIVVGAASERSPWLGEIIARVQRETIPFSTPGTNFWLSLDLDAKRTAGALGLGWKLSDDLPRLSMAVSGDGGNVLTHGELTFAQPLPVELDAWVIPTNLVREPLTSFTAIRGFKPWLAAWKTWNDLQIGAPPSQAFFWSLDGAPMQTYWAAPVPDASNRMRTLMDVLLRNGNPWLASHSMGSFARAPDANGAVWGGLPLASPFIKSVDTATGSFVFGGLLPNAGWETNRPPSSGMIQDVVRRTNLVYYDWEVSGPRIEPWLYIGQVSRLASRHGQLSMESAGIGWLRVLSARLDRSTTLINRTGTNQLSFIRKSTVGLTAPELHLLVDWLESPQFPRGLHSSLSPPDALPGGSTPPTGPTLK